MRLLLVAGALAMMFGCGASQQNPHGEVFCQSYEKNYVLECRKVCEQDLAADDEKGFKTCEKKCRADLQNDETYADDCVKTE